MLTNNMIREYLGLPRCNREYLVEKVDTLCPNTCTLMFINKPNIDLDYLDSMSEGNTYLLDSRYSSYESTHNDFISLKNPKFVFSILVKVFKLKSKLQLAHADTLLDSLNLMRKCPNIVCYETIVGNNCQFDIGSIIGGTDFSPVIGNDRSELIQFPQMGGVKIGDNVRVGYNSMIGKGTFGYTQIGDNTMIDYGCQVGHNCIVGKSCIIAAGTIIGGSTKIGDNVTIGMGAKIRNGITIGNGACVGMGAVVVKDVPDNCVVIGNPARIIEHKHIIDEGGLV